MSAHSQPPEASDADVLSRVAQGDLDAFGQFYDRHSSLLFSLALKILHDHSSSEELFILSGHLQTEGRLLGPGDFLHAEPGTHHHELVSPDGCVALIINRTTVTA